MPRPGWLDRQMLRAEKKLKMQKEFQFEQAGLGGQFEFGERGQPMQIYNDSRPFYPFDPDPDMITIETIAHNLAQQTRCAGNGRGFYSVAQHSCIVMSLCEEYPLEGLLHDAAEAYIGDLVKPLKIVSAEYKIAEKAIDEVIADKFGLAYPWPYEVKMADLIALATEKRDLCVPNNLNWGSLPDPMPAVIHPISIEDAEKLFLTFCEGYGLI